MKIVISLILKVIFAIALIVSLSFLRDENYRRLAAQDGYEALKVRGRSLQKENYELQAELEKNIAARSRLKEMLAEARKSSPEIITTPGTIQNAPKIPASLLSERTAKPPASKPNASEEQ